MAAVAEKLKIQADYLIPVQASSKSEALDMMMAGQSAIFEQGIDADVQRAATGLIETHRSGRKVDIELFGLPHEVLEQAAARLRETGASQYMTARVMQALEQYIVNTGADFTRAAKAKPLYVRIMVTNEKPDDLPQCDETQSVFLDGVRKLGGEAARIVRQMTVFGPKSTTSQGVDLDKMFSSRNEGVFIHFGSYPKELLKGQDQQFNSTDAALLNVAQGMASDVGGGGAPARVIEEIKTSIVNNEAPPPALKLIETVAVLAQTTDAMKTPGVVNNAPARVTEIVRDITSQIQTGVANRTLPSPVVQAAAAVVTAMQTNQTIKAVINAPNGAASLMPKNDNKGVDAPRVLQQVQQVKVAETSAAPVVAAKINTPAPVAAPQTVTTAPVVKVQAPAAPPPSLPVLATQAAPEIKTMIAAVKKVDALPPALAQAVTKIDTHAVTVPQVAQALQGKGPVAAPVQAVIVALATPAVSVKLPPQVQAIVNQVMVRQAPLVQAVVAQITAKPIPPLVAQTTAAKNMPVAVAAASVMAPVVKTSMPVAQPQTAAPITKAPVVAASTPASPALQAAKPATPAAVAPAPVSRAPVVTASTPASSAPQTAKPAMPAAVAAAPIRNEMKTQNVVPAPTKAVPAVVKTDTLIVQDGLKRIITQEIVKPHHSPVPPPQPVTAEKLPVKLPEQKLPTNPTPPERIKTGGHGPLPVQPLFPPAQPQSVEKISIGGGGDHYRRPEHRDYKEPLLTREREPIVPSREVSYEQPKDIKWETSKQETWVSTKTDSYISSFTPTVTVADSSWGGGLAKSVMSFEVSKPPQAPVAGKRCCTGGDCANCGAAFAMVSRINAPSSSYTSPGMSSSHSGKGFHFNK